MQVAAFVRNATLMFCIQCCSDPIFLLAMRNFKRTLLLLMCMFDLFLLFFMPLFSGLIHFGK